MAKRFDIKKIMVIGSGPVVIGQAAEYDDAGTQTCTALRQEGYEVVLVNPNSAAVTTDSSIADKVYMEPLTLEYVARILRRERPDAILPGIGGQTSFGLTIQLAKKGILRECRTELLGANTDAIETAETPALLETLCQSLDIPFQPTDDATDIQGWKAVTLEVLRDGADNVVTVCEIEHVDPVCVHPGDAIAVTPCQSVPVTVLSTLRASAAKLIRALQISGCCSICFALSPNGSEYRLTDMTPRLSRTSALAFKATGYPVAQVSAKAAVGLTLDDIMLGDRSAHFDPVLDYVVTKTPRFPFDKFADADNRLVAQMKATGGAMAIGKTLTESLMKAIRALDTGAWHVTLPKFESMGKVDLLTYVGAPTDDRIHAIAQLFRLGAETREIVDATGIAPVFLDAIRTVVETEPAIAAAPFDLDKLETAKKVGFSDKYIATLWNTTERAVWDFRAENRVIPEYLMLDTCARDDWSYIPFFYSSYNGAGRHGISSRKKIIILGAGPVRIGQGVEFDYTTVHAVNAVKKLGYEAIVINSNPEAVSTNPATGDKLYLEPLTTESVMDIIERERPLGIVATLGGQTTIDLAEELTARGATLIGTGVNAITLCENRDSFEKLLLTLGIPQPTCRTVTDSQAGSAAGKEAGYPVLLRPSCAVGGKTMQIVGNEAALRSCLKTAMEIGPDTPVLVEKYIEGREVEVDAVCDGTDVFIAGIMEHVERTGIHSGDSISIYPAFSVSDIAKGKILAYTKKLGKSIGIVGLYNVQFIVGKNDTVYVIEVTPRASRTVPFIAKATGWPLADIATFAMLGKSLREQGIFTLYPEEKNKYYVKVPTFSFSRLLGMDTYLSTEMKSTGEAMGCDLQLTRALYKALQASGLHVQNYGTVFATIADANKAEALPLIRRFYDLGFNIEATRGTAAFLKENGIRTHICAKISEGSGEILDSIRSGHVTYVINTRDLDSAVGETDGMKIRRCATNNNVAIFTSLDTVRVLLTVLEEMTIRVETIDA